MKIKWKGETREKTNEERHRKEATIYDGKEKLGQINWNIIKGRE